MRVLIADDSTKRANEFRQQMIGTILDWADTPTSAITLLSNSIKNETLYDYVFLDHDFEITLGSFTKGNGQDIPKAMQLMDFDKFRSTRFVVHSLNGKGAKEIAKLLSQMGLQYVVWRWAWRKVTPLDLPSQWEAMRLIEPQNPNDIKFEPDSPKLQENVDYYYDNGLMVLSESFLNRRGTCCENGCRHCPYGFSNKLP